MEKVKLVSVGCKVNTYEINVIRNIFLKNNYQIVGNNADIVVVNTCAVTHVGAGKSRQKIRKLIKENNGAITVVMGCLSAIDAIGVAAIEGVSIIIGTADRYKILEYIKQYKKEGKQIIVSTKPLQFEEQVYSVCENTRAYLKIQDGCDNFCSYCVIPYTRGRSKSRPKEDVLEELNALVQAGYSEIVLTGIHTGGYKDEQTDLANLIKLILENSAISRLRISSIEINEISPLLLELMATDSRLARAFHIPLQSGSDNILNKMRRHYNKKAFIEKIEQIKEKIPDIFITTDVIVGFPTETEQDFLDTVCVINQCSIKRMHIFEYSPRPLTVASNLEDIPPQIKKERANRLAQLNKQLANLQSQIGQARKVLIEKCSADFSYGYDQYYNYVEIRESNLPLGKIVDVMISDYKEETLIADVL